MNYFKPELLARCRSLDDAVAEAAAQEWEEVLIAYRLRYRAIKERLPVGARLLSSRVCLHDAKVMGVSFGERKPRFSLRVQLDGSFNHSGGLLELKYHPVGGPHGGVGFRKQAPDGKGATEPLWVLYDEFDVNEERAFFTHSLLMTSGFEMQVRFHSLRVRRVEEVISPLELTEQERTWPLTEV